MSEINKGIQSAKMRGSTDPWAATVEVYWTIDARYWGRRKRWRRLSKALKDLQVNQDYQIRHDMVMDSTIIHFRNKDDAVSAYFYFS